MDHIDIHNLQEAYLEVCEGYKKLPVGKMIRQASRKTSDAHGYEDEHIDPKGNEDPFEASQKQFDHINKMEKIANSHNKKSAKAKSKYRKEDLDIYDIILTHLLDEGYANTEESANSIMSAMSEDWRESILEGAVNLYSPRPATYNHPKGVSSPAGKALRKSDELREKEPGSSRQKRQTKTAKLLGRANSDTLRAKAESDRKAGLRVEGAEIENLRKIQQKYKENPDAPAKTAVERYLKKKVKVFSSTSKLTK